MEKTQNKKIRPLGRVTEDLEKILHEMCVDHELQWHEVKAIVSASLAHHFPGSKEPYVDGSYPIEIIGHPSLLDNFKRKR